jgi:hypothetical protein
LIFLENHFFLIFQIFWWFYFFFNFYVLQPLLPISFSPWCAVWVLLLFSQFQFSLLFTDTNHNLWSDTFVLYILCNHILQIFWF